MDIKDYKHVISLGHFCSVALEIERFGLRDGSYPFDWCISDFEGVVKAIENNFSDYFKYELLSQSTKFPEHYRNDMYDIQFFHDFDKYKSLECQIDEVAEKYDRRISRFYKSMEEPTLFIRYISDAQKDANGKSVELVWIEENYHRIQNLIKSYNGKNDILFIGNNGVSSEMFRIYNVEPDENDTVARAPFDKNEDLLLIIKKFEFFPNRENNIKRYLDKQRKKNNMLNKIKNKINKIWKMKMQNIYIHNKNY